LPAEKVVAASARIREMLPRELPHLYEQVENGEKFADADREALIVLAGKAKGG
jgi:hypothetical protein